MLLSQILSGVPTAEGEWSDIEIGTVEIDSRKVEPGALFIALNGTCSDGRKYIPDAVAKGAAAVLYDGDYQPPAETASTVFVKALGDMRENVARAAANFYKPLPPYISAVTGTNGKTSIADFTRQLMRHLGYSSASIGTIGVVSDATENIETLTTPDSVTLHRILRQLAQKGVDYVSLEASSIGIEQYRLDGLRIKVAGFTNFTQDHLDYHRTMENYRQAKELLFSRVMEADGTAVLNADIAKFDRLEQLCRRRGIRVMSYGNRGKELKIVSRRPHAAGQTLETEILGQRYRFELPLIGEFQAMNVLCAVGMVIALHGFSGKIIDYLPSIKGAPGRLDLAGRLKNGAGVYVDYAHTPDALENVLKTMRHHTEKKLWVVFGCGGDRDKLKRPLMGKIARELADRVVVTDDNPRTEDAAEIRRQIMAECSEASEIGDRVAAIEYAVSQLEAGDMLVIAGKGHENGQKIGDHVIPMNDMEEATKAIAKSQR